MKEDDVPRFQSIEYQRPEPTIARLMLNRADTRNAQDTRLLYELNKAFDYAAADEEVRVIILAAHGPHFSSGHDMRESDRIATMNSFETVGTWCGFGCEGAEAQMAREKELYTGLSERWRNIPKPTIAEVHGKVISGGLMLIWPCDLIVASEDAQFADNTVQMGVAGAEYFNHPWELGVRKAKEMLFTSRFLSAVEAERAGMINYVVTRDELSSFTMQLARDIAAQPPFVLKLVKEAVNAAQDAQGRVNAMQTSFALHQLSHAHNLVVHGAIADPAFAKGKSFGPISQRSDKGN
jgi:enoyl-CoA hydratase